VSFIGFSCASWMISSPAMLDLDRETRHLLGAAWVR